MAPVAREADRWAIVLVGDRWAATRVAFGFDGEATPRSTICRFAGGGWPYGSSRNMSAWERAFLAPFMAAEPARMGELATLGLVVERGILLVDMAERGVGSWRSCVEILLPYNHPVNMLQPIRPGGLFRWWCGLLD